MFGNHLLPHVPVEFARDLTSQNGVLHVMQHVHGVYSNVQIAAESNSNLTACQSQTHGVLGTYCMKFKINESSTREIVEMWPEIMNISHDRSTTRQSLKDPFGAAPRS